MALLDDLMGLGQFFYLLLGSRKGLGIRVEWFRFKVHTPNFGKPHMTPIRKPPCVLATLAESPFGNTNASLGRYQAGEKSAEVLRIITFIATGNPKPYTP